MWLLMSSCVLNANLNQLKFAFRHAVSLKLEKTATNEENCHHLGEKKLDHVAIHAPGQPPCCTMYSKFNAQFGPCQVQ